MLSSLKSLRSGGRSPSPRNDASSSRGVANFFTMPQSRDAERGASETDSLISRGQHNAKRFLGGFIDFAFQGNVLQIAFGMILATTFTDLVRNFVRNILMPPIVVLLPINKNMEEKFAVLRPGPHYNTTGYNTLQQAQADGAVIMAYGSFANQVVSFGMMGLTLYLFALFYTMLSNDPVVKHLVKCKYCRVRINEKSKRCIHCTSWLDGREERVRY